MTWGDYKMVGLKAMAPVPGWDIFNLNPANDARKSLFCRKVVDMGTAQLREELHKYIDQADDRLLRLVKGMFQAEQNLKSESESKAELIKRAKLSEKAIDEGRTKSFNEFNADFEQWKIKKRANMK